MPNHDKSSQIPDHDLERFRIRYSFYKTLVGSALVGVLAILIPGAIEFFQAKQQEVFKQQEYVKEFVDTAIDQDIELRLRFALYFSKVSPDKYKSDWHELYTDLKKSRDTIKKEINDKEKQVRGLLAELAEKEEEQQLPIDKQITLDQLVRELEWRYKELGYVEKDRSVIPSKQEQATAEAGQWLIVFSSDKELTIDKPASAEYEVQIAKDALRKEAIVFQIGERYRTAIPFQTKQNAEENLIRVQGRLNRPSAFITSFAEFCEKPGDRELRSIRGGTKYPYSFYTCNI